MDKEKSTWEKTLMLIMSHIIDNCPILFYVNDVPPIEIYKPVADGIIIKEEFE